MDLISQDSDGFDGFGSARRGTTSGVHRHSSAHHDLHYHCLRTPTSQLGLDCWLLTLWMVTALLPTCLAKATRVSHKSSSFILTWQVSGVFKALCRVETTKAWSLHNLRMDPVRNANLKAPVAARISALRLVCLLPGACP